MCCMEQSGRMVSMGKESSHLTENESKGPIGRGAESLQHILTLIGALDALHFVRPLVKITQSDPALLAPCLVL